MTTPLAVLIEGVAAGAVPGLLAAGLALVHRTTGLLSFAHGALGAAGAHAAWALGLPPGLEALGPVVAFVAGAVLGAPLVLPSLSGVPLGRETGVLTTLGYGLLLETLLRVGFGSDPKAYLHVFAVEAPVSLPDGGFVARSSLLLLVAVGLGAAAAALGLGRTRFGLALRALGADRGAAAALGLCVTSLEGWAWALSGGVAGVSGWLVAPRLGLEPQMMWSPLVTGFGAAALGGLDHPGRALLAGLGLGLVDRLAAAALGGDTARLVQPVLLVAALVAAGRRADRRDRRDLAS